ncbi:SDR family NAD(P)-dependent oxidoreductase [Microbacterium ulmi]|uniref:SDR family oxidoreductase n=1 Tax=Microbacterium ulmi TaxID=179095 RepID=A0A7Y2Q0E5_9MICO|nr:SDR family NAD(P)-dependent oxidoreductase [Microbacterium ulmi]NII69839.1 NAD(P)-dependent dehydrogenase (short-subunit alcohol dehydrogenase family) [Microbacterium ulmi]NNH03192.1 SDR family oxidoreductase [Microbacterium ulmi]
MSESDIDADGLGLSGRTVVVTGGASGIGLATVKRLLAAGANVGVVDLVPEGIEDALDEVDPRRERTIGAASDTTDEAAMTVAVDTVVARFGALDGLVTAAGVRQTPISFLDLDLDTWATVQRVLVKGTLIAVRIAARVMIAGGRGGSIVTIASVTGLMPRVRLAAYCSSKAGVIHLTKVVALELARHDIRANVLAPALTLTPRIDRAVALEGDHILGDKILGNLSEFRPGIPLGRAGRAEEQANAIVSLLSPTASFTTGAVLSVDGGVNVV